MNCYWCSAVDMPTWYTHLCPTLPNMLWVPSWVIDSRATQGTILTSDFMLIPVCSMCSEAQIEHTENSRTHRKSLRPTMALELAIAGHAFYSPRCALAGLWAGV